MNAEVIFRGALTRLKSCGGCINPNLRKCMYAYACSRLEEAKEKGVVLDSSQLNISQEIKKEPA